MKPIEIRDIKLVKVSHGRRERRDAAREREAPCLNLSQAEHTMASELARDTAARE